ncbi:hypothetical protein Goarm_021553, partial [Gossypium armourianum]|nr:hypothetical protein [Gossypium armourianum]
ELKEIWAQWDDEVKQLFYYNYGDLPYLLDIKVEEHLFRALAQFWNFAYSCFTFGKVDLVPTVKEYTVLLHCSRNQADKAYSRAVNVLSFVKNLMNIIGMTYPDTKKKVDVFALSIYGLIIFLKALGHIDEVVTDLFDRLDRRVTPVPVILAKTFRSLNPCRRMDEDVEWRAPWMVLDEILYRCENFDWVPLLGIWGAIGYTLLLVLRQYRSRQFILATQGMTQCEFSYKGYTTRKIFEKCLMLGNKFTE